MIALFVIGGVVLAGVVVFAFMDMYFRYKGYKDALDELKSEPKRWVDLAIAQGYQFFECPTCGEPIMRGGFDENSMRICGRCDCVYKVKVDKQGKYSLDFLGHSLDITSLWIKRKIEDGTNVKEQHEFKTT